MKIKITFPKIDAFTVDSEYCLCQGRREILVRAKQLPPAHLRLTTSEGLSEAQDLPDTDKTERQSDFTPAKKCNDQNTVRHKMPGSQSWSTTSYLKELLFIFIILTLFRLELLWGPTSAHSKLYPPDNHLIIEQNTVEMNLHR